MLKSLSSKNKIAKRNPEEGLREYCKVAQYCV